ncbi:PP2C family protein-serine/threonine phosphatase [Actinoplanes sp. GCM10030250]|uniref:PP2C family protein-serine/threonine phosphatase n=1 Tax=Actinoplanes sp. GCM10030250 TaxID=3273376 RepID=UPI00361D1DBC
MRQQHRPLWQVVVVVAAAYTAGALLAFLAFGATSIVVLFLPAGVTLSALLLTPGRQWPWILATVAVIELAVDTSQGITLGYACGFALANTVEPLVGASLLRRYVPSELNLLQRRHLFAFLGCCVVAGPLAGALIGGTTIAQSQHREWAEAFLPFWAGDATGALTVAGTVLAWRHRPPWSRASVARWGLILLLTVTVTAVSFWPQHLPLFYMPLPLLYWLGFQERLAVTMSAGLTMTVTANVLTSAGHGPWAALDGSLPFKTATLQLFLAVAVVGAWLLTVGIAERDNARALYESEVSAARQLQHALLPAFVTELPAVRVSAGYRPADLTHDVGGDWYDVFPLPSGRIGFAVGDVVGHDLAAAAAMARLQAILRVLAQTAPGPAGVLTGLDRASTVVDGARTCTVGYADYHPATRLLRYACAGHPPPLLITGGRGEFLWEGRSLPVAVEAASRREAEVVVPPGAHLIWYTDGLVERRNESMYVGMERLAAAAGDLAREGTGDPCEVLLDRMSQSRPASDDTAVLWITFD